MATLKTDLTANWTNSRTNLSAPVAKHTNGFIAKYLAFVDGQKQNRTLWFLISLSVHAAAFLPVPIMLIGYFNAPIALLSVTMVSFFANFVANMGGSNVRTTISLFLLSILVHITMITLVVLL